MCAGVMSVYVPNCTIHAASNSMKDLTVVWRWRIIVSLRRLPTRRMVSVSTRARRSVISPSVHKERTLPSVSEKPSPGLMARLMARKSEVVLSTYMMQVRPLLNTVARRVSGGVLWCRRCTTCQCRAVTVNDW